MCRSVPLAVGRLRLWSPTRMCLLCDSPTAEWARCNDGAVQRGLLAVAVAGLLLVGCGGDEPASVDLSVAPWQLGGTVDGQVHGPFHVFAGRPITGEPTAEGWQTVLLPEGNPIEAFNSLVEEAQETGFDTNRVGATPCWQQWGREETRLGDEPNGQTPLGEQLPPGSTFVFIRCHAVGSRSDGNIEIFLNAAAGRPGGLPVTAIVVRPSTATGGEGDAVQELVPEFPDNPNELPSDEYLERIGVGDAGGAELVGSAVIDLFDDGTVDDGWCQAMLYTSPESPGEAARRAVEGSVFGERGFLTKTVTDQSVLDTAGAAFGETIAADGGTFVVSGVATDAGTELLVCRASF